MGGGDVFSLSCPTTPAEQVLKIASIKYGFDPNQLYAEEIYMKTIFPKVINAVIKSPSCFGSWASPDL